MRRIRTKEYLAAKGQGCLFCQCDAKISDLPLPGKNVIVRHVTCERCGKSWRDVYTVTDVELLAKEKKPKKDKPDTV